MSHRPTCQTTEFFVLRSPGLPLGALFPVEQSGGSSPNPLAGKQDQLRRLIRGLIQGEAVREAVALASPDLASRIEAWLEGSLDQATARNVERALLKYLGMPFRS